MAPLDFNLSKYIQQGTGNGSQVASAAFGVGQILTNENTSSTDKIQAVAEKTLSFIFSSIADAQEEARNNVDQASKKNNDLQTATQTQVDANKKAIDEKVSEINENLKKIQEILQQIQDFEDEKQDIEKEVENHQKEIDKQVEAYENATTNEDRIKALEAISNENIAVRELLDRVNKLSTMQADLNSQGEEFQKQNGNLEEQAEVVMQDGESKINALNAEATANKAEAVVLAADEGKYNAKGAEYAAKAAAAKAGGAVTSFFSFGLGSVAGEAEAAKYMQLAQSNFSAAGIIGGGVPEIFSTIGNVFDGTNTNLGYLNNSSSLVGSLTAAAEGDIESFFGISNSLGSWLDGTENWEQTNQNIETAVESEKEEVSEETETDQSQDGDGSDNDKQKKKFNAETDYDLNVA